MISINPGSVKFDKKMEIQILKKGDKFPGTHLNVIKIISDGKNLTLKKENGSSMTIPIPMLKKISRK